MLCCTKQSTRPTRPTRPAARGCFFLAMYGTSRGTARLATSTEHAAAVPRAVAEPRSVPTHCHATSRRSSAAPRDAASGPRGSDRPCGLDTPSRVDTPRRPDTPSSPNSTAGAASAARSAGAASACAERLRLHSIQILLLRFIVACSGVDVAGDLRLARQHFTHLYTRLFHEHIPAHGAGGGTFLFGHATIDIQDVIDVIILVAANVPLDASAYGYIYWAAFTLLSVRRTNGRRLADVMEARGFVFDTNFAATAADMRVRVRAPTVWKSIQSYVEQLCALLVQPEHNTIAGVYNDIVARCHLPVPEVSVCATPPCRLSAVHRLVRQFYQDKRYRPALKHYVSTFARGNAASKITLNGVDTGARLAGAGNVRLPVFVSADTCAEFALQCAEGTFLPVNTRRDASWHMRAYRVPDGGCAPPSPITSRHDDGRVGIY